MRVGLGDQGEEGQGQGLLSGHLLMGSEAEGACQGGRGEERGRH